MMPALLSSQQTGHLPPEEKEADSPSEELIASGDQGILILAFPDDRIRIGDVGNVTAWIDR